MTFRRALPLLLVFLVTVGCAGNRSRSIPSNVNNVYFAPVKNNTSEPGLENMLTDEATQQILADGRVELVDEEEADVTIESTITNYKRIPLIYNDQDIVQQYKVRIEMSLRMIDTESGKVLNQFDNIFRETTYSDVNPPAETEFDAQQRVLRKLSRDIVTTIVEGWPYLEL